MHRTAQGKQIDMDLLRKRNELVPAVGNARVNARGDELGPGGKIVRKREDIVSDYYKNTNAVPSETAPRNQDEENEPDAVEEKEKNAPKKKRAIDKSPKHNKGTKVEKLPGAEPSAAEEAEWEETDEGDFVKKGS